MHAQRTESASNREVSWRTLPRDFGHDQKQIWLFPTQLAKGHGWLPTVIVVGGTAGLVAADAHIMPFFRRHEQSLEVVKDGFDPSITTGEVAAVPVGLLLAGYARDDAYAKSTAWMAGEAYADSAVVDLVLKAITRRQRPADVPDNKSFEDTFFHAGKSPFKGSSFPSGHAAGAFSVATVVATRYHDHRWVPWAVYGLATVVSATRVIERAHFPSEVFLGGSLGYAVAHYQVLGLR